MTSECGTTLQCFPGQARGVREVLQTVEDALVEAGYDQFVLGTKHGAFQWQTHARARADMPEPLPGDELEH